MSLTMHQIDGFIDTTIHRLSGERGEMRSSFYVDLRSMQQRITQNLVEQCVSMCESRGLVAARNGDGLTVTVDLHSCHLNSVQAAAFNNALSYTRQIHGNHV